MDDKLKLEFQALQKLEAEGSLDETQTARFEEIKKLDLAEKTVAEKSKDLASALAQKEHFRTKAEKEETERKALEAKLNEYSKNVGDQGGKKGLDVEDYINISASLEGLDAKEKERLAREHKLTGVPLAEIRKDEDFVLWQTAYRTKLEKEKLALKPTGTQADAEKEKSFAQKLAGASLADKEKILTEAGLYKQVRPRADRTNIGVNR